MSKYTTELRFIVEQAEMDARGVYTPGVYTSATYESLGMDKYPIFDESYRKGLSDKIIDHFYFREIGFETRAHFAWQMRRTLNEIMPYFNPIYEAIKRMTLDPLTDRDMRYDDNFGETEKRDVQYRDEHDYGKTVDSTRTDATQEKRTDDLTSTRTDDLTSTRTDALTQKRTDDLSEKRTDDLTSTRTDALKEKRTDDLTETTNTGTTVDTSNRNVYQDTPMSMLPGDSVKNLDYATNVTYDDGNENTRTETTRRNSGTQMTDNTGTQTSKNTGSQTVENDGTQTVENTGTQTSKDTGSQTTKETGTQTVDNTGTQKTVTKDAGEDVDTGVKTDSWQHGGGNTRHEYGRTKSQAALIKEYMDAMVNVDMEVIASLETLFMGVW